MLPEAGWEYLETKINSRKAVLISEMVKDYMAEEDKIINEMGSDPLLKLKSRELDIKAKADEAKKAYDDSKPKRPRTAYAFYMKENRARIAKHHPNESPRDLMKYIAASWKECDDSEKSKYTKMAADDRERWSKDRAGSL